MGSILAASVIETAAADIVVHRNSAETLESYEGEPFTTYCSSMNGRNTISLLNNVYFHHVWVLCAVHLIISCKKSVNSQLVS